MPVTATSPTPTPTSAQVRALPPALPVWLTRSAPIATISRASIDATSAEYGWSALAGPARCDVAIHVVVHPTEGLRREPTDASAAVLVPVGPDCETPRTLVSYSRGTEGDRARTLANPSDLETRALAAFFATRGHVVVASDYLGYAQSSYPFHPYLNAESEAQVTIDAMRAARRLIALLGVPEPTRMVLTGYSQGGHVALATQRAIERDRPEGVAVDATGGMSGPYDLAGFVSDFNGLLRLVAPLNPLDARTVVLRLGGLLGVGLFDWLADRDALRDVLVSNSVIGWRPVAPLLLCGGARDTVVPFANTLHAAADFTARGAPPTVVDVEQVPAWRALLPPAGAGIAALSTYHAGVVPPLCMAVVRDALLDVAR